MPETEQNATPPFDQGNRLLAACPAEMATTLMQTPDGQRLVLTIRTTSATVTVLLDRDGAAAWGAQLAAEAAKMSGSGLIVAGADSLNGGGPR